MCYAYLMRQYFNNNSQRDQCLDWSVGLGLILTLASPCIIIQIKQINQLDTTVSQVYYLTFMCRSTCFGCFQFHHQELTTTLTASDFTLKRSGSSVVGRGLVG
jgi:hypothetical protein